MSQLKHKIAFSQKKKNHKEHRSEAVEYRKLLVCLVPVVMAMTQKYRLQREEKANQVEFIYTLIWLNYTQFNKVINTF